VDHAQRHAGALRDVAQVDACKAEFRQRRNRVQGQFALFIRAFL